MIKYIFHDERRALAFASVLWFGIHYCRARWLLHTFINIFPPRFPVQCLPFPRDGEEPWAKPVVYQLYVWKFNPAGMLGNSGVPAFLYRLRSVAAFGIEGWNVCGLCG
jgi:hypothetical protein